MRDLRPIDSALADHVRHGLNWEVLSSSVGLRWPELLQMIQAAGNATLPKYESELQVLSKTFQLIVSQQKPGIPLDFISITCGSCFAHFYQFSPKLLVLSIYVSPAELIGGMADTLFVVYCIEQVLWRSRWHVPERDREVCESHGLRDSSRREGREVICHEVKGSKNQLPFFRHGLLKLALTT